MQVDQNVTSPSAALESELKMQREAYERAGVEAYVLGVPRNRNPYLRPPESFHDAGDRDRFNRLADHWWRGWDSAAVKLKGNRRPK
jgi:hypothetical protein